MLHASNTYYDAILFKHCGTKCILTIYLYTILCISSMVIMTKATVRIPKDKKHRIVIPNELWEAQELEEGNLIEVDIVKIKR